MSQLNLSAGHTATYVTLGARVGARVSPPCYFTVSGNVGYRRCTSVTEADEGEKFALTYSEYFWNLFCECFVLVSKKRVFIFAANRSKDALTVPTW